MENPSLKGMFLGSNPVLKNLKKLQRTGAYYFISTIADNCWNGQKLNITVGDESNPTAAVPAAGPSLTTSPGTSIPPLVTNSASSLVSTLSPVFFMAIALVLMC
ncbi:hypothetical protein E1A91_D13G240500v1 [Gossypium mustelinum]|uniref:Phytocyanin domain-containing protein n=1 Tax=Gossypium mustelinum TaxID=34275 RepID=A0A5D2S7R3_GOSMU|nr:hypothetical protein E1A91_D13G240500v1 [Gossypium mustelinum]